MFVQSCFMFLGGLEGLFLQLKGKGLSVSVIFFSLGVFL
jgi:hypothetical protein